MAEQFDVVVAGLGAFGACACEALARRGARVLGLDRHGIPHALGSSHGAARATHPIDFLRLGRFAGPRPVDAP